MGAKRKFLYSNLDDDVVESLGKRIRIQTTRKLPTTPTTRSVTPSISSASVSSASQTTQSIITSTTESSERDESLEAESSSSVASLSSGNPERILGYRMYDRSVASSTTKSEEISSSDSTSEEESSISTSDCPTYSESNMHPQEASSSDDSSASSSTSPESPFEQTYRLPELTTGNLQNLQSQLQDFLPKLKRANKVLHRDQRNGRAAEYDIEALEDEEQYIEMDLDLGVLEERRSSAEREAEGIEGSESSDEGMGPKTERNDINGQEDNNPSKGRLRKRGEKSAMEHLMGNRSVRPTIEVL